MVPTRILPKLGFHYRVVDVQSVEDTEGRLLLRFTLRKETGPGNGDIDTFVTLIAASLLKASSASTVTKE